MKSSRSRELPAGVTNKAGIQIIEDKKPERVGQCQWDDVLKSSELSVCSWPSLGSNSGQPSVTELYEMSDNLILPMQNCVPDIADKQSVDSDCRHLMMEKTVQRGNSMSMIEFDESKSCAVTEDSGDASESKNLNNDYRMSSKMEKQLIKENRRRKREEAIRKRRIEPKCTRVKMIDGSLMEKLRNGDKKIKPPDSSFQLNDALTEFPDLCAMPMRRARKRTDCTSIRTSFCEAGDKDDGNITETSEVHDKKIVKTGDPIEFNIGTAIALQKKQKVVKSDSATRSTEKKRWRLLSGNELDSDSPMRKRGKVRENGKIKLSRVKRTIQLKESAMNESKVKLLNCNKLVLNNILDKNDPFYQGLKKSLYDNDACGTGHHIDAKVLIHNRKFKYYCDQWPNKELNDYVHRLIKAVVKFQDRQYACDPIKAYARRRYVCGFKQVLRCINISKVKLVVIATDIECVDGKDGLLNYISQVTKSADAFATPYVYCGSRWSLKSSFKKKSPISCAGILNYEGAEELYRNVIRLLPRVKELYREKLNEAEQKCGIRHRAEEDVTVECITSVLKSLSFNDNVDENASAVDDDQDETCPFMSALLKCVETAD